MATSSSGGYLKADTATTVVLGPFLDATDFVTPETGITLGAADEAELIKHNSGSVVDISGNTFTAVTGADGYYALTLTAAQLDTEGRLTLCIGDASVCCPVRADFMVVNANVFDSLFAAAATDYLQTDALQINGNATSAMLSGTDKLSVDVEAVSGSTAAADNLEAGALGVVTGAVSGSSSTTTSVVTNLTESTNDHYNGRTVIFTSGALAGQAGSISDYNGSAATLTVGGLTEAPADTDTFVIV